MVTRTSTGWTRRGTTCSSMVGRGLSRSAGFSGRSVSQWECEQRRRYDDAAYVALLDRAAVEPDTGARAALYRQAEVKLITEDAACLPLWFGKSYVLIKPEVKGYTISPLGFSLLANVSVSG